MIYNQAWNIKNYRYVGDVSPLLFEPYLENPFLRQATIGFSSLCLAGWPELLGRMLVNHFEVSWCGC